MKELGFFIDNKGRILYYGQWKEPYDKHNRREVHETSFIDDVEANLLFQSLNLNYNPKAGLYSKGIAFAMQGMILMINLTFLGESKFIMYTPCQLTEEQKGKLAELYSLLSSFKTQSIASYDSVNLNGRGYTYDVDSFYDLHGINKEKSIER